MTTEELLQSLGVDLEGSVLAGVAFDDLKDAGCDVLGLVPVLLVPLLQQLHLAAKLDVELDVGRETRAGEVA